jgi:hypothetical protein
VTVSPEAGDGESEKAVSVPNQNSRNTPATDRATKPLRALGVRRKDVTDFRTGTPDAAHPTIPRMNCPHVGTGDQFVGRIRVTESPRVLQEVCINLMMLRAVRPHRSDAWHRENLITAAGRTPHPVRLSTALHSVLNYLAATYGQMVCSPTGLSAAA